MGKRLMKALCVTMAVVFFSMMLGCSTAVNSSKPTIVTTIYPLYEFTKQVAGDKADVLLLVPSGAEPHDWEPAAADLIKVKKASVVIYNGAGFEPWLERVSDSILVGKKTLAATGVVPLIPAQYNEEGGPADSGALDPHVWLDPVNAQAIVQAIAVALSDIDRQNAGFYQGNAAKYNTQLATLDAEYRSAVASATRREIVTSHAAFGYLANRYGLKQVAIMGLSPDAEPTPDRMAQIIRHIRSSDINYIFFETLVSPKLSAVITNETGARALVLNPIEGLTDQELAQGENYISVMRMNLSSLKYALGAN